MHSQYSARTGIRIYRFVLLMLLFAVLPLRIGATALEQAEPRVWLSATTGYCDTQLTVSGSGFLPGPTITFYVTTEQGGNPLPLAGPPVSDDGTFSTALAVNDILPECKGMQAAVLANALTYLIFASTHDTLDRDYDAGEPSAFAQFIRLASTPGSFDKTWARTDQPVADGSVARTWMWGPEPFTEIIDEPYAESPDGERQVRYYDKSRMEVTHPDGDLTSQWYVTNGLLVVEMVEGQVQTGDSQWQDATPAGIPVAGDMQGLWTAPTYADINHLGLRDQPAVEPGTSLELFVRDDGEVRQDWKFGNYGVTAAERVTVPGIDHTVADVFWDFMMSSGTVFTGGQHQQDQLFPNPFYATGYPITEAYWATISVDGSATDVLWQCFERRCLTYTPRNTEGWQVESGNVGLHYHYWRYADPELSAPVAFSSNRAGSDDIWSVEPDGSNLRQLTNTEHDDRTPVWSPDGTRIAFFRGTPGEQEFSRHVVVMNADGSAQTQLTVETGMYSQLSWSPNGSHIAYLARIDNSLNTINIVQPDGSGLRVLTPEGVSAWNYDWSPDGERIVFEGHGAGLNHAVFTLNVDGTGLEELPGSPPIMLPAWSPDGTRIATMHVGHPESDLRGIYITELATGVQSRAADIFAIGHALEWSPDSSKLAFTAEVEGRSEIFVLNVQTNQLTYVSEHSPGEFQTQLTWSSDSQWIAFTAFIHGGNQELYIVRTDATGLTTLTNHPAWDREPAWSPAGE